jgi:hypothetical protein
MAGSNQLFTKSFLAGGTIVANQIVKFGSADDTVVAAAAATDLALGVSLNAAASGERVEVQLLGIAEVKAGGTIARGDYVVSDANGDAVALAAATTIKVAIGRALRAAVDNDIVDVLLTHFEAVTA